MSQKWQYINDTISYLHYYDYLEIGIRNPANNFEKINAGFKIGVDPAVTNRQYGNGFIYSETSDVFFLHNVMKFDIIFIDGLHTAEQALRDVINSLKVMRNRGTILMHDVNPRCEQMAQEKPIKGFGWCGTVWKAWAWLRMTRDDLYMYKAKGYDLGVIIKGSQELFGPKININDMDWKFFEEHKAELLKERDV